MRLRRLEMAILGVTVAFAVFMGGYFTGRNFNNVSVTAVTTERATPPVSQPVQESPVFAESQNQESSVSSVPQGGTNNTNSAGGANSNNTQTVNDGRININTASQGELTDLPGIGNTLAARIVDYRARNGNFARIDDIRNVTGIGERRFEAIKELITVGN